MLYYLNINRSYGMHALANDELDWGVNKVAGIYEPNALMSICRGF